MKRIKYQLLKYVIDAGFMELPIDAATDKQYDRCTGIYISVTDETALFGCTINNLQINSKELFPEGYEIKLLTTGIEVPPDDRFYTLDEPAAGSIIKGKYVDNGVTRVPYGLTIYLKLENNEAGQK